MQIEYLIKILIGLGVVIAVIWGISKFGGNMIDFFRNLGGGEPAEIVLSFLK